MLSHFIMVIPTHIAEKGSAPSFREREETRSFYTETLLHTESFTHKHFYLASSRNALFHLASSWTSKLRTQFVSLTLGMGIIVEHHDAVNYMHHTVLEGNIHKGTTNPTAW